MSEQICCFSLKTVSLFTVSIDKCRFEKEMKECDWSSSGRNVFSVVESTKRGR